jgi:phosphoglycolate phosphatase
MNLTHATIAFDLDGTLVDSAPDIHTALNRILAIESLPPATLDQTRTWVGHGARLLIQRAAASHGVTHTPERLEELFAEFIRVYADDIATHSTIWPGVESALDALAASGARLVVCTNKPSRLSNLLLDALGLLPRFEAVIGPDMVPNRKPHADHYLHAIRAVSGDPARSLMVGDSAADIGSAHAAGAPCAIVSFGYTDTAPELLGADAVFDHFDELPGLAARLLSRQPTPRM